MKIISLFSYFQTNKIINNATNVDKLFLTTSRTEVSIFFERFTSQSNTPTVEPRLIDITAHPVVNLAFTPDGTDAVLADIASWVGLFAQSESGVVTSVSNFSD